MGNLMGGGLSFLNKKPWHPGSIKNIERTTKCEIADEHNKKKIIERIKDLKKDRELEELLRIGDPGSAKIRDVTLDWMYGRGLATKMNSNAQDEKKNRSNVLKEKLDNPKKLKKNSVTDGSIEK